MKKNIGFTEIALALVTILVIFAIVALILGLAYPNAMSSIIRDIRQGVSGSDNPVVGALIKVGQRIGDGFNYRFRPALDEFSGLFRGKPEKPKKKVAPALEFTAEKCTECHKDLFERRGFGNVYIDHRLHAANNIKCGSCHSDIKHPQPKRVAQVVCLACHKREGATVACESCHPPGSVANKKVIPQDRLNEFFSGRTASSKSLMPPNFEQPDNHWLRGEGNSPCKQCHEVPDFCNRCHLVFHNTIGDWRQVHGPRLLRQEYVMNVCWTCHNANWCAATCHSNTAGRQRRGGFLPVPTIPLDEYIDD